MPISRVVPTLVSEFSNKIGYRMIFGHYNAALARCYLLVWVERKNTDIAKSTNLFAIKFRTYGLTSILNDAQMMTLCDVEDCAHIGWAPEGVDDDNRFRTWSDCCFDATRVEIQCLLFYINKDWSRPFIAECIGHGYEGEGRHDNFIVLTNAQRSYAQMECACP